jgi:hypothetical protein
MKLHNRSLGGNPNLLSSEWRPMIEAGSVRTWTTEQLSLEFWGVRL